MHRSRISFLAVPALVASTALLLAGCSSPAAEPSVAPTETSPASALAAAPTFKSAQSAALPESTQILRGSTVETTEPTADPTDDATDAPNQLPDGYGFVADDLFLLTVVLPDEWSDVDGRPYMTDDGRQWASLVAAPSLDDYSTDWQTPGLEFSGTNTGQQLDDEVLTDFLGQLGAPFDTACTPIDDITSVPYDDGLYVGFASLWSDCGGETTDGSGPEGFVIVAQDPAFDHFVYLRGKLASDDDKGDTFDLIMTSFQAAIGADSFTPSDDEDRSASRGIKTH